MTKPRLTQLLQSAGAGEEGASEALLDAVYQDLRRVARAQFSQEAVGHTLQPTALVSEAWMRLSGNEYELDSRAKFFAAAGKAMRRILIEHARKKHAAKRGGKNVRETMAQFGGVDKAVCAIEVDDALQALEKEDASLARIVELRFFAGLTVEEIAEVQGISAATVKRHWKFARAWLFDRMGGSEP